MATDWGLVRETMMSAIDACERFESMQLAEPDRATTANVDGREVSVFDILTSAWIYPEKLRYEVIRRRHYEGGDQPYVPEAARILVGVAQACAELIGAGLSTAAKQDFQRMNRWYRDHAVPLAQLAARTQPPLD